MIHKAIQIRNLELRFPHKLCFDRFNSEISHGSRIAIIGRNGSGKSTLLKILQEVFHATDGDINKPEDVIFGYVPQIINDFEHLSGGQRFNEALTRALSLDPNVLLLDEPTNHLDVSNRQSLMRMLRSYSGTLIVVTHDTELLRKRIDTLWHINQGKIHIFSGRYDDYISELSQKRASIEQELSHLSRQKKDTHQALMKEQKRAAKSKSKGVKSIDQRKWPTVVSQSKAVQAEKTSGRKKSVIAHRKKALTEALVSLHLSEVIVPKFSITSGDIGHKVIVSVRDGDIGYQNNNPLLQKVNLSIGSKDRVAIMGDNASGKSTLMKALLGEGEIVKVGDWLVPKPADIGYLDQHYRTLSLDRTVFETIADLLPDWSYTDVRRHLNDFLFRQNEEVGASVALLSGGEKARLSLAQIGAKTPKLLILDEITNNLDLETRDHVISVLKKYPGAMIVLSHDVTFLKEIGVKDFYHIKEGSLGLNIPDY